MNFDKYGIPIDATLTNVEGLGIRGRVVHVEIDVVLKVSGFVTEYFGNDNRFLVCSCPTYEANHLICDHITKVYDKRLDVTENDPDAIAAGVGPVVPFEVDGQYNTTVVIMGYRDPKLTVDFKLVPYEHPNNPDDLFVSALLEIPSPDDRWENLGLVPFDVGRMELRNLFIEWIIEQQIVHKDEECTQPWHAAHQAVGERTREQKLFDQWMLMTLGICGQCATDDSIPQTYDPMRGAIERARREQSRSRADNPRR